MLRLRLRFTAFTQGGVQIPIATLNNCTPPQSGRKDQNSSQRRREGFTLTEVLVAVALTAIGFLGANLMVLQCGKLVSAGEEEGMVCSGLEERMDDLRDLEWTDLTSGTGVTTTVWQARPQTMADLAVVRETISIQPYDLATAKSLNATWPAGSAPSFSFTTGSQDLSAAKAVKVAVTITWITRRAPRQQTRTLVSLISRGGISKSDL